MTKQLNLRRGASACVFNYSSKCFHLLLIFLSLMMASCHSKIIDDLPNSDKVNVNLKVSSIEQIPFEVSMSSFTKATSGEVSSLCSMLSFTLYQDGERVTEVSQKLGDEIFGSLNLSLSEGDYQVVVIGHNGDGKATFAGKYEKDDIKVQFSNNKNTLKMTDTFLYSGTLSVGSQSTQMNIDLKRAVAMFCIVIDDEIPQMVTNFSIECTGGSNTLGAISGHGIVRSTQTESYIADPNNKQLFLYTFPRGDSNKLSVTISAKDKDGNILKQLILEEVPITVNRISKYTGSFFKGGSAVYRDLSFPLSIAGDWSGTDDYQYNQ